MNYFEDSVLTISEEIYNFFNIDYQSFLTSIIRGTIKDYKKYLEGIKLEMELGNQIIMPSYKTIKAGNGENVARGFEDARLYIINMAKENNVAVKVSIIELVIPYNLC